MKINNVTIEPVSAECFTLYYSRLITTSRSGGMAENLAIEMVGCATSIIGCGCEAAAEAKPDDFATPDGRPGDSMLFFAQTEKKLEKELIKRIGQVALPSPTAIVFNHLVDEKSAIGQFDLGKKIGYFGNRFERQIKKYGRQMTAIPITAGEFLVESEISYGKGIGANFWIMAASEKAGLRAAVAAVSAIKNIEGLILPFASGFVAAASRVGSCYDFLKASTQEDYCPTISEKQNSNRKLPKGVEAVYELVIDAVDMEIAKKAMAAGIEAACIGGVVNISAANFGGKLGSELISLHSLFE